MILLALGGNLGDRADYIARAHRALESEGVAILRASSILETTPMLPPDAPEEWNLPFLNQVLIIATDFDPDELLACVKRIETQLGREKRGRWGPREIDIDILAYNQVRMQSATLTLPHPGMLDRDFVLRPMSEIAPNWRHPVLGKTVQELLK